MMISGSREVCVRYLSLKGRKLRQGKKLNKMKLHRTAKARKLASSISFSRSSSTYAIHASANSVEFLDYDSQKAKAKLKLAIRASFPPR